MGDIYLTIGFFVLISVVFVTFLAIKGNHQFYWVSAIGIYLLSYFVLFFGIGSIMAILSFVLLTLAIGYSFGWIRGIASSIIFICLGILVGILLVFLLGEYLFYPLDLLFSSL